MGNKYNNINEESGIKQRILCTQPRRIAAINLAKRVSYERSGNNNNIGIEVGYTVRYDTCMNIETCCIQYATDGIIIREAYTYDPLLNNYSIIMIDEAHERNIQSDLLLAIVKKIVRKRKKKNDLKIIICSATINATLFLNYFIGNNKKRKKYDVDDDDMKGVIISIDGRQYNNF